MPYFSDYLSAATAWLVAAALIGASGCGEPMDSGQTASAGDQPRTISQPLDRMCGADKYDGPQGADVSKYQGDFDWAGQKQAGLLFGFARISDGLNFVDATFDQNWQEMQANGILRGSYQYFRPAQDATAQANMVVDKVGQLGPGDLPAVVDVEADDGQSGAVIADKLQTWLDIVEQGTGKKPIIYTAAYFWQEHLDDTSFRDYPLWVANYGPSCPLLPDGWSDWTFWQYCGGQPEYCTNGQGFDRDVFNGSVAELQEFANSGVEWSATYVDQTFPLSTTALTMSPGDEVSGYIELKNTGQRTWGPDTRLATTEPRNRESIFVDDTWLTPTRPAVVDHQVAPGETYQFEFTFRAPDAPGTYREHFGLTQEGVAWFSDPDQGGPPDDQLQVKIRVLDTSAQPDAGPTDQPDADQPDAGQADAGRSDAGGAQLADTGGSDRGRSDAGERGPPPTSAASLIGPSTGRRAGCSQRAPSSAPTGLAWLIGAAGLLGCACRTYWRVNR